MKKTLFLSDFHLGAPDYETSLKREKMLVSFLKSKLDDTDQLFLVGDLFDFWFEYKSTVPKYFIRFLGVLSEFSDKGIPIHIFTGNHDLWMRDYFKKELNANIYHKEQEFEFSGKSFYIAHGDGLGPGDFGYKFLKKLFTSKVCQLLFRILHPDIGISLADFFSKSSRAKTGKNDEIFLGENKEWLVLHSKEILRTKHYDYFIYGHRHLPKTIKLSNDSEYLNLGDWIKYFSYAEFNGTNLELKYFNYE